MRIELPDNPESREKALRSMANHGYLTVWEGSVRSSKTVLALCAFALYVTRSPETSFLLSGRTVGTVEKNCIMEDYGLLNLIPGSQYRKVGESRALVFTVTVGGVTREKHIYVFGAADIRAYMAIRGNSYGGWLADEINMHDREFVVEALKRTVASKDRRHMWTLNPDNPRHWVYTDYLDRYDAMDAEERRKLGGYAWFHFTPEDNPALTPAMLDSLRMQYADGSYLYQRYVLGLRVIAEGLVYARDVSDCFVDYDPLERIGGRRAIDVRYCAIDFGQDHPTVMIFGGPYMGNLRDWRFVREYYDRGTDKTVSDYYRDFLRECDLLGVDPGRVTIAIDPAAKALRLEFMHRGLSVVKAKNDVLPGIGYCRALLYAHMLTFHRSMFHLREELGTYAWDPKASESGLEKPIKLNDDAADAWRYFCYTHIRPLIGSVTRCLCSQRYRLLSSPK